MSRHRGWSSAVPFALLAVYWSLCFLLTHVPLPRNVSRSLFHVPHQDKIAHFLLYAGLAALITWILHDLSGRRRVVAPALYAILLAAVYGALDEWLQSFVPSRSADPFDWLADVAGASLGATAIGLLAMVRSAERRADATA
ncbi:MAG TPA: hypothetical protein DCQ98_18075 [Planctomycetaceae bacterium]|nr:hypothetical protein [Planctomycetaceae bacterium]HRF02777.1 VanZ family protein [Pirellulaceae bacterium]